MTEAQSKEAEKIKFGVFMNIEPFSEVTEDNILSVVEKPLDGKLYADFNKMKMAVIQDLNRLLTLDEERKIQVLIYTEIYGEE